MQQYCWGNTGQQPNPTTRVGQTVATQQQLCLKRLLNITMNIY
jgi:hypothetical protein